MNDWGKLASEESLKNTVLSLEKNGMEAMIVENGQEARKKVAELLPAGVEVMDMSSETLRQTGIAEEIEKSGKYDALKPKLYGMHRETQAREMQRLGGAPEYTVGSVHAVTEEGQLLIASNTGSQLGAYAYGSDKVIWVVGGQKIVKNIDEGMRRIYEYVLPLESERVKAAYGMAGSNVSKLLIFNKEIKPGRAVVILVREVLGF